VLQRRPYSEQTQQLVDKEVARLLRHAEQHAVDAGSRRPNMSALGFAQR